MPELPDPCSLRDQGEDALAVQPQGRPEASTRAF
jgi:hypothetical protein